MNIFYNQMLLNKLITKINLLENKINAYDEKINYIQNIINENNINLESKINFIQSYISNNNSNIDNNEIINLNIDNINNNDKKIIGKSVYNNFIKDEINRIKLENQDLSHKEIFKLAANNWKYSDKNIKNINKKN